MIRTQSYKRLGNGKYLVEMFENGSLINSYEVDEDQVIQQNKPTELDLLESNLLETQYQTVLIELLSGV